MSKRFVIGLALEEAELEVDKKAEEIEAAKTEPETKKVLDDAVEAAEKPAEELTQADMPAEIPEAAPAEETPEPTNTPVEVPAETPEAAATEEAPTVDVAEPVAEEAPKEPEAEAPAADAPAEEKTEAEETPAEEPAAAATEETEQPVDSSMSDVSDAVKQKEDDDEEVEVAAEAIVTLESIVEELENSLDTGGLSPTAAAVTEIATRAIYERVGFAPVEEEVIATESFTSPSSRIRNTKIAIESITDKIKSIINAIIASIGRAVAWIKNFVMSFLPNFEARKIEIKNLRAALAAIKNDKLDPSLVFDKVEIINYLKAGKQGSILKSFSDLSKFTFFFFETVKEQSDVVVRNLHALLTSNSDIPELIRIDHAEPRGMKTAQLSGFKVPEGLESYVSDELFPGEVRATIYLPKTLVEDDNWNTIAKQSEFNIQNDTSNVNPAVTLPFLTKQEIATLLDTLEALCDKGIKAKEVFNKFAKDREEFKKDLAHFISAREKSDKLKEKNEKPPTENTGKEPKKVPYLEGITARNTLLTNVYENGSSKMAILLMKSIKAGISYSGESIRAYLEPAKPATP